MHQSRSKVSIVASLILLMLLTQAFACTRQGTAQKVLNKIAVANQSFERAVTKAHTDALVDDATERSLLEVSRTIAKEGNDASDAFLAGNDADTLKRCEIAITAIDGAMKNGVGGIKNPGTVTVVDGFLLTIRGFFTTAESFLATGGVK